MVIGENLQNLQEAKETKISEEMLQWTIQIFFDLINATMKLILMIN
jgi:hypothetical protein